MGETLVDGKECGSYKEEDLKIKAYPSRETSLGELEISRALPIREHRLVGPWCFLDRFGPLTFTDSMPMNVLPHPHIGLQTVTWLLDGEVLHTDSIDSEAIVRPGGVNIMTAGNGIAHAELTPQENSGQLNGVQLWTALPDEFRKIEPAFDGIQEVPIIDIHGGLVRLFAGTFDEITSPGTYYSELIGLDLEVRSEERIEVELDPEFEHAVLVLDGHCRVEDQNLQQQILYYFSPSRSCLPIQTEKATRLLLIGGIPFKEKILMWWNFVARKPEEIAKARADWEETDRFRIVRGNHEKRLSAPTLARFADPNPAS